MAIYVFPTLLLFSLFLRINAQSLVPLTDRVYNYSDLPYQICAGSECGIRGPMPGYNICNETTQNQNALCETAIVRNIADFCFWAGPQPNSLIGNVEASVTAYCTLPIHGTRTIPPGTLQGVQFLYAKNYIQIVGMLEQGNVDLDPSDTGGELDPRGADEQGNPIGGVIFTNSSNPTQTAGGFNQQFTAGQYITTGTSDLVIVTNWNEFIGSGVFCMKLCWGTSENSYQLCDNVYDEIGCNYNMPADYSSINGTFEVCDSDDMTPVGEYVVEGTTSTWTQPFTGTFSIPYTPTIPASSNCHSYSSEQLYASAVSYFASLSGSSFSGFSTSAATSSGSSSGSMSGSSMTSSASTGTSSGSLGSFDGAKALPFITAGFAAILITVVALLA